MKKEKLIPELRFPEFVNEREWSIKTIDELCIILNNIRKPITSNDRKKGSYPYYGASGIIDFVDDYLFDETLLLVGEDGAKWGAYGSTAFLVDGKYWVNNHAHVLKPNLINEKLLESYLVKLDLHPYITGAAPPKLTLGKLKEIPVPVPDNPQEQQKIASCLSSLDEVIAAHSQKLDLLKDHKKGLMQNLFPQNRLNYDSFGEMINMIDENKNQGNHKNQKNPGSDNLPKYRFKEFEKDGEWVEKKLGDVYHFLVTNSFSRDKLNYENGTVKNIHYGDIHTKFSTLFDIEKEKSVPFVNLDISIERIREECYCLEGDIIFADASEDLNDVGKSIEIVNLNGEKLLSGLHTLLARQKKKKIEVGFGGYLFKSDFVRKQIQREAQGAKVLGISAGRISSIKISFPSNPQEQQKIASCLSSLDALITAQAEKIAQLQQHKKGLMQGLFPKSITN